MDNDKKINETSSIIGSTVSNATSAVLSSSLGLVSGNFLGSAIGKGIELITKDVLSRFLSKKESDRVETVASLSLKKIQEKLDKGGQIRDDSFFKGEDKSDASEIYEGILLTSKNLYEEKKLELLANLFTNIAFDDSISTPIANHLIKLADDLTYRQLLIIKVVAYEEKAEEVLHIPLRKKDSYTSVSGSENVAIATEIYDLYIKGCLSSSTVIFDPANINSSALKVTGYGANLYNLMELEHIELDELLTDICDFLNRNKTIIDMH